MDDDYPASSAQVPPESDLRVGPGPLVPAPFQFRGVAEARAVLYSGQGWRLFLDNRQIELDPGPTKLEIEKLVRKLSGIDVYSATNNPGSALKKAWFSFVGPHVTHKSWHRLFKMVKKWDIGWARPSPEKRTGVDFVEKPLVIQYSELLERLERTRAKFKESKMLEPLPKSYGQHLYERTVLGRRVTQEMVDKYNLLLDEEAERAQPSDDEENFELPLGSLDDDDLDEELWKMNSGDADAVAADSDNDFYTPATPRKRPPDPELSQGGIHRAAKRVPLYTLDGNRTSL